VVFLIVRIFKPLPARLENQNAVAAKGDVRLIPLEFMVADKTLL
jgi:hypothetical protein